MAIAAPKILFPAGDFTTDVQNQTISGTTDANQTSKILVNGSQVGVSYTKGEDIWSWAGSMTVGANTVSVVALDLTVTPGPAAAIIITYVPSNDLVTTVSPSGVSLKRYQDKIEVICAQNTETNVQVQGYNFYVSYQSGGVNNQYVKINSALVPNTVAGASSYEDVTTLQNSVIHTVGNLRTTTTTEEVTRNYYFSSFFDKVLYASMVQQGLLPDVGFNQDVNFYFVVTAIVYDAVLGQVTESSYSPELEGSPITITTGIRGLPARTQNDIILTYSKELLSADQGIDTKPGTVIRDEMDPVSEEGSRVYIIQDFLSRSLSVTALQDFDDANGDGISDPVDQSVRKKALQLSLVLDTADEVQKVVDDQFDALASNDNIIRKGSQPAVGSVVFYVKEIPIRDMMVSEGALVASSGDIDQGIPSQMYRCTETVTLEYANRAKYFNAVTQRYEITVAVESDIPGSAGNAESYTIKTVSSGADGGFSVENPNPVEFGVDSETNHDLATRIQLARFSDTGTTGGYAKTTMSVSRVRGVRVEKAGDPLMFRDYDPIRKKHIGGKVDIYVQGEKIRQYSDNIAFSFSNSGEQSEEQFTIINAVSFQFETRNSRVSAHTPIFEVTHVKNHTRSDQKYHLGGYTIIGSGNIIDLNENDSWNASIGLAISDVILVTYKYRSSDTFVLSNQPVSSIVSVVGQLSGTLDPSLYELVKLQDPLEEGGSTIATDGIRINFTTGTPITQWQSIVDESHVLILGAEENLDYIGVDALSIIVTNSSKSATYVRDEDYTVMVGTETTPTSIQMIETGLINNGDTVLISYTAIENFSVAYTSNALLGDVQAKINDMKHACADVIVKNSQLNSVDFVFTIIPKQGVTNTELLTSKIETAIANYLNQVGVGVSVPQSDIINVIETISDVDYVVVPFQKMTKTDGSFIVRDNIGSPSFQVYNKDLATAYISAKPVLTYKTRDKGGPETLFRGVFEDKLPLVLQDDPTLVSGAAGRAYITAEGKIIVSTKDGTLPDTHSYQVAYFVYGEKGSKDINVASLEYLEVGSFNITYDTPRLIGRQMF